MSGFESPRTDQPLQTGSTASIPSAKRTNPPRPSLAFIQNKLRKLTIVSSQSSRPADASSELESDIKGPLGLNLLHEPSEPRIDFIFVHGLGGGSRKTWSHSPQPGLFWPQDWLPNETGFRHVRLHSYGYHSDWTARKGSPLTVHDFGQALLADLYNSPHLRKHGETPIVLVAHSMGGLVAKKAYLLATRDPTYNAISQRIHAIYFLGTPHRGADSAELAKLVSQSVGFGSKAFLDDLLPGSGTLDQINDEFRHVCTKLRLWSFFEGVQTNFGLISSMVVDKQSAVIGLPGEHVQYIGADHRHICKFDTPASPNYIILQRAFLTTIQGLETTISAHLGNEYRSQMKQIAALLRADSRPDAILLATHEKQLPGSCVWLTDEQHFQDWVHGSTDHQEEAEPGLTPATDGAPPRVLWLHGKPGTGKSVAAGHVVRYLQSCNLDCSFYFFKHEFISGSTVAALLLSLAFQMAEANFEVRRVIASMAEDHTVVSHEDHHSIWASLFLERIFKVEFSRPQFWIIDAVDECSPKGVPSLVSMLSKLDRSIPIRVLITSRPGGHVGRCLSQERTERMEIVTGQQETMRDIEQFLRARWSGVDGADEGLVSDVLSKSSGIFLWASLTVSRMEDAYTVEDKQEILEQIPPEMDELYSRIVVSITKSSSCALSTCVLRWAVCSATPLHIRELAEAVRLDIGRTLTASASQLETIAGHLIFVDNQSRVRLTHETALAFLTQEREGFWIDRSVTHSRIAGVCLTVLNGGSFVPPRLVKGAPVSRTSAATYCPLADYAALHFSHHLVHSSPTTGRLSAMLIKFLETNLPTLIEKVARTGSLWPLKKMVQELRAYTRHRVGHGSTASKEAQTVATWADEINRVVALSHAGLLASPSSIHTFIPHFCPRTSMVWQHFANSRSAGCLRTSGRVDETWGDRLAFYDFRETITAVACSPRLLAFGFWDGRVEFRHVAESGAFSSAGSISLSSTSRGKVTALAFSKSSSLLAIHTSRTLVLLDVRTSYAPSFPRLWARDTNDALFEHSKTHLSFSADDQFVALAQTVRPHHAVRVFRVSDGWIDRPLLFPALDSAVKRSTIGLDTKHELMASAESERSHVSPEHVKIWDLESAEVIGTFRKELGGAAKQLKVLDVLFNPVAELKLLAISYSDGDVVTCDPWTMEQKSISKYVPHILDDEDLRQWVQPGIINLAATSDGRMLVGLSNADIRLFSFENLCLLYRVAVPEPRFSGVHRIAFSSDNLQIFSTVSRRCSIWEPPVLAAADVDPSGCQILDSNAAEPSSPLTETPRSPDEDDWRAPVPTRVVIDLVGHGKFLLWGQCDGTIEVCEATSNRHVSTLLHGHLGEVSTHMDWNGGNCTLLIVCDSRRCVVVRLSSVIEGSETPIDCLLDHAGPPNILQAFLGPNAESVVLRTKESVQVIGLDGSIVRLPIVQHSHTTRDRRPHATWLLGLVPSNTSYLIFVYAHELHAYEWGSLDGFSQPKVLPFVFADDHRGLSHLAEIDAGLTYIARWHDVPTLFDNRLLVFNASAIQETTEVHFQTSSVFEFKPLCALGCLEGTLYFLDRDEWVSSIDLKTLSTATQYTRHFFIPGSWRMRDLIIRPASYSWLISTSTIAFKRPNGGWVVFHGFLDLRETVPLGENSV